ncbi:MAG: nucleotidyltransferase family protein [Candidatus Omnitrophota bacterium]
MGLLTKNRIVTDIKNIKEKLYMHSLKDGQNIDVCVHGDSMYPYIKDYDILTIAPNIDKILHLGDIVAVRHAEREDDTYFNYIHRLVKITSRNDQPLFFTKADNAAKCLEGYFVRRQILGKVITIKRNGTIINTQTISHRIFNRLSAYFSLRAPLLFKIINNFFCLILEYPLLVNKMLKRFQCADPLFFNAQQLVIAVNAGINNIEKRNNALNLIKEGVRWNRFCDMVIDNGRSEEIIKSLKTLTDFIKVPTFVFERLQRFQIESIGLSEQHYRQSLMILEIFSQAQIKAIPLKGTYLSKRLYGDISMRGMSADIDFLIKEEDEAIAVGLLEKNGYKQVEEEKYKTWRWNKLFIKKDSFPLHLLWDITMMKRSKERIEGFWKEAKKINLEAANRAFFYYEWPDETLLLYLCVDLVNSRGYRSIKYFYEIATLIEKSKNSFDWDSFIKNAIEYRIDNSVFAALHQTKYILGTGVPDYVLSRLKPGILKRLLIKIFLSRCVIFNANFRRRVLEGFLSYVFFEILEAGSIEDCLKIIKRLFPPPQEVGWSKWQYAIYILRRFSRLFNKIKSVISRH